MTDVPAGYVKATCWSCATVYFLPRDLYTVAKANTDVSFFCPHGHSAHYPKGETGEDKMRRERDRLAQQIAQKDDEIAFQKRLVASADKSRAALQGQITKMGKRASAGTCQCCNRTFSQLQRHMKTKHPDFKPEDNVVRFKAEAVA